MKFLFKIAFDPLPNAEHSLYYRTYLVILRVVSFSFSLAACDKTNL